MMNAPGQSSLRLRVGDHGSFMNSMLAGLSDPTRPALASLRMRLGTDFSVALLDASATMLDVLTFYRERIANEGYWRTATERRSLVELARLVAYRPRPGVAAGTYLAFTVEQGHRLTIPVGTKALSVPGQDELPQTFETSEALEARAEWSQLAVRRTRPQNIPQPNIDAGPTGITLWFKGTNTGLRKNDPLLVELQAGATPKLYRVLEVVADLIAGKTRVTSQLWRSQSLSRVLRLIAASSAMAVGASATTDTGKRVLRVLARLDEAAVREKTATLLDFVQNKALPELQNELARLSPAATRIKPWLSALVASLEAAVSAAQSEIPAIPAAPTQRFDVNAATNAASRAPDTTRRNASTSSSAVSAGFKAGASGALNAMSAFQPGLREIRPALVANAQVTSAPELRVYAFRVRASLFGSNASPKLTGFDGNNAPMYRPWNSGDMREVEDEATLHLDSRYDAVAPDSWIVIDASAVIPAPERLEPQITHFPRLVARVVTVSAGVSRTAYGITGPTTTISIADANGEPTWIVFPAEGSAVDPVFLELAKAERSSEGSFDIIRRTTVLAGSELLELDEAPIDPPLCDGANAEGLELAGVHTDLRAGRWVIVSGERTDIPGTSGIQGAELRMIAGVRQDVARDPRGDALAGEDMHTFITLATSLDHCYRRSAVTVWGNVVHATHGELRHEVLGAGQGAQPFQQFTLRASPLTYVAAPTPTGTESTLDFRVNEVRWHEVDSLAGATPTDHIYVTSISDDGKTTVMTGDGVNGARLPTGRDNVRADYRTGIGRAANVRAGQISLLGSRPLGLKEVINPLRTSGGADADSAEQIRRNIPLGLQSFDRLVSLRDYADFANASGGIGKASASRLSDGRREVVQVTVAGVDDAPITPTSDVYGRLLSAFAQLGDGRQPVLLATRELVLLVIGARVRVATDYRWDLVEPHIRAALLTAFSFDRRDLAQSVHSSEVIAVIAKVPGVAYVDLDTFGGIPELVSDGANGRRSITPTEITALVSARASRQPLPGEPCNWLPPSCPVVARPAGYDEDGALVPAQLAILSGDVPELLVLSAIP
ncbi:MAG: putative baseplate assembly protein [Gemmatimonadaceae bacterium]